jgi:hypothetical protein
VRRGGGISILLEGANDALIELTRGRIRGAKVLKIGSPAGAP